MIPFNFDYFKPETLEEALKIYSSEWKLGKKVIYLSGGTEVITFARGGKMTFDSVIDLKGIPECTMLEMQGDDLVIGAAVTLNRLVESNHFPLLSKTVRTIADHTSRNKITIGGNLMSKLGYREGILPFLITDAIAVVYGPAGTEAMPVDNLAAAELAEGQFLTQVKVAASNLDLPFVSMKRTRSSKVGYPIVSLAALRKEGRIRIAFSGIHEHPFRSAVVEGILNDETIEDQQRIDKAIAKLPTNVTDDFIASKDFRKFVLNKLLTEMNAVWEGSR
ncbi:FAD binding domain-containing protein [Sporosarcina luteola]|uniref:FAD binding domain-containing protein n=1 Tax=Sporosarcina luteola TaxID=582850 RepID=UPI00203E28D7|nr:FAD binding domain-containing protein [Sporosarcina luteola]MCM3743116.1 FAD binding domain-containing protein [Sporosarcina luteola]